MFACQPQLQLLALAICVGFFVRAATESVEPQFVVISEDVIPDIENTTQKVIRVNPLDLPSKSDNTGSTDSTLFNIQTLRPRRKYINSNVMRKRTHPLHDNVDNASDSPIVRHVPSTTKLLKPKHAPKQHLHFIYDQADLRGQYELRKTMGVRFAPGAYPIYYAVAKTNGRFGKYPIKGFRTQAEFMKYLLKSKASMPTTELEAVVS